MGEKREQVFVPFYNCRLFWIINLSAQKALRCELIVINATSCYPTAIAFSNCPVVPPSLHQHLPVQLPAVPWQHWPCLTKTGQFLADLSKR